MRKTTSFNTDKKFAEIKAIAEEITRDIPSWSVKSIDETRQAIVLSVGISFISFGETVEITMQTATNGVPVATVTSSSVIPTTLFDYGKNKHNLTIVQTYLTTTDIASRQAVQKTPNVTSSIVISVVIVGIVFIALIFLVGMYMYYAL